VCSTEDLGKVNLRFFLGQYLGAGMPVSYLVVTCELGMSVELSSPILFPFIGKCYPDPLDEWIMSVMHSFRVESAKLSLLNTTLLLNPSCILCMLQ